MTDDHNSDPQALVVAVRFRPSGPVFEFDPGPLGLEVDDRVLVESDRGPSLATVVTPPRRRAINRPLRRVIKKADRRDLGREDRALQREHDLLRTVLEHVRGTKLAVKVVSAEPTSDAGRVTVYYSAEDRLDLRDLANALADVLHARVELKQIGARDAAKVAGGLGVCGRELCCSSWLREFQAVSVKMVKEQGLSLNMSKLAGQCGRLKCCMRYEYATYQDLRRALPPVGTRVESVKGNGQVVRQNILRQTVLLRLADDGGDVEATLEDLVAKRAGA